MNDADKIEYYLLSLERVLQGVSLSKRSEVILEVKNKIEMLKSTGVSIEEILGGLGPVDVVARNYGVIYQKPYSRMAKIAKWILITSLFVFLLFMGSVWWFFHKFIKTDSNFDFHMNEDQFTIGGVPDPNFSGEESLFEESKDVQALGIKKIEFKFSNGKVRYSVSDNGQVSWRCKITGINGDGRTTAEGDTIIVNLVEAIVSKCDVKIPEGVALVSKGGNGEVKLVRPKFNVDLKLGNGKLLITPEERQEYIYDLEIVNGRVGEFISSQKADALSIRVRMTNGTIEKE